MRRCNFRAGQGLFEFINNETAQSDGFFLSQAGQSSRAGKREAVPTLGLATCPFEGGDKSLKQLFDLMG
jgi:hypothetical protein